MRFPVLLDPKECIEFARDTWSLAEAETMGDMGMFMYLQDVIVIDGPVKLAPKLSAWDHLHPEQANVEQWWYDRRSQHRIDDMLQKECRVFCDPRFARDASEQDRMAQALQQHKTKRARDAPEPSSLRKQKNPGRRGDTDQDDSHLVGAHGSSSGQRPLTDGRPLCQVFFKGLGPSGASIVWRCHGWRPFFFALVETRHLTDHNMLQLRSCLAELCKYDSIESVQIEPTLAPRLIPFAYDPANPRAPKNLLWWRISFDTVQGRQRAAKFLNNKGDWTLHPQLFRFPADLKREGFLLAEHVIDDAKMLLKTCQININTWLTIAHDAVAPLCQKVPPDARASIAQFEWIVPSPSCIGIYESSPQLVKEAKDPMMAMFERATDSLLLLERDTRLWHAKRVHPKHIGDEALHRCLPSSSFEPPMVDATVDIEVSGNIRDESIFPEPQFSDYTAYLVVTILSFKGSVPGVWRSRGVQDVNEPFAIMIHSRCPWSSDATIELDERDAGCAKLFGCIQDDESQMYEIWSDWVFRVAQTDVLSHFNGDHFDMPYVLCRLTGNPMRPMDSFSRPMRKSRFPWIGAIWSLPMKPYWKRLRARDKRKKGGVEDGDDALAADEEIDSDSDEEFEDVDNMVPLDQLAPDVPKAPEEEITDQTQFDMIMQAFGVSTLDLMKFAKEIYKNFDEYSLNYLAGLKLKNISKLDVKPAQITQAWHYQNRELLELVTSYCVRDVYVTVRLDKEFKAFMTMNALAFASTTPLSTLLISGSQKRLLNCLVQFSSARGFICNGIRDPTYASTGSYAGGKVQEAVPGIHKTTCVDFASLYPSIMQCKNLCYCTFVPTWMVEKMSQQDRDALILECFEPRPGVKYWFVQSFMGIVPAMLNYFVTRRRQVQRESKKAFDDGNEAFGKILDLLQLALKILANATYGFTGVGKTKGPMLGLQAISETTTFLGREAITLCHDRLTDGSFVRFLSNERPQLMASVPMSARVEVVYGDTDSLFFSWTEDLPMPLIFELGNESGDFLTNEVRRVYVRHTDPNNPFKVEHEKSGWGLYIRKKMYAMVKFEKIPDCERWETTGEFDDKNLMIRGLRPTRRDTFGLLRSKGKQILKEMLGWRPLDQASGLSRQEHRALVIKENVGRVMGTLNETIRVIMGSRTTDAEERKRLVPLFQQTGELRASYSAEAAVAPHMAIGWKFHYDFGSRVPFILCTAPDVERLKRPDGLHKPTATAPKYTFSAQYGPSGYNVRDFSKPYKSLYGKAAYARHPQLEYLAPDSTLQINRSHYLQLFSQLVNIFFVPGIPGAELVPSIFVAAREQIHCETMGVVKLDEDMVLIKRAKALPPWMILRK